ncbi:MAG: hypothetical protein RRY21_03415 [Oscillospiraceae bacterium]
MIFECCAIVVLILSTSVMLSRPGKGSGYGIAVLPLLLVPLAHILGIYLSPPLGRLLPITAMTVYICVDLLALVATCMLLGGIATRIRRRRSRWMYLMICGGFSAVLTCVLLVRSVII